MNNIIIQWNKISLSLKIFIGLIVAIILGYTGSEWLILQVSYLGKIFMHLLKLTIAPLIFCSLTSGLISISSSSDENATNINFKVITQTIYFFFVTGIIASFIGLAFGFILTYIPISNHLVAISDYTPKEIHSLGESILGYIPDNLFKVLISNNVISLIILALLTSYGIHKAGKKAKPLADFLVAGSEISIKIARLIIEFTPIAIIGLISPTVHKYGINSLLPLLNLIIIIYVACVFHIFVVQLSFVRASKLDLSQFIRGIFPALSLAFSSSSSYGTLPLTLECASKNLGISKNYSSFSLPLGATINMDACGGIYPVVASLFIAKMYNIDLSLIQYAIITAMAIITTMGTAGIPGASLVTSATFLAVGLPIEGIAFLLVIDRVVDMIRTATNVCGDLAITTYVAHKHNLLDTNIYNHKHNEKLETVNI